MAPPSGASNPPRGPIKKPVVPAIPYNLPHRHNPHQRQQSQQSQPQVQKQQQTDATIEPTSQRVHAVKLPEKDNQKTLQAQQSSPTGPSKALAMRTSATSTITDSKTKTATSPTTPDHASNPKTPTTEQTLVEGAFAVDNTSSRRISNGITAPSKKNTRHRHASKPNHPAARAPAVMIDSQSKSDGAHEGKFRKASQQPSKVTNQKEQGTKATAVSDVEVADGTPTERHLNISQPSSAHEQSTCSSNKEHASEESNSTSSPKSTGSIFAAHSEQPLSFVASSPELSAARAGLQAINMQGDDHLPTTSANGINGATKAEPVYFPSRQQEKPGPSITMHHPYPSNGSLVFGEFQGSNASSPGPPLSGGYMPPRGPFPEVVPPPGFRDMNGAGQRCMNSGPGFSGPPPMIQLPARDFVPVTTAGIYGRPPAFAPYDGYPPMGEPYGPETPHSFQGSASPLFPEHESGSMEVGAPQLRSASPNHFPAHPGHFIPLMMNPQIQNMDTGDNLLDYVKSQFNDVSTADCTLEFRPVNLHEQNVYINGHRLILARSPVLKNLLQKAISEQTGLKPHVLLETDDRNVKPIAFYSALQRLYGHSLLQSPHPANGLDMAGTLVDRLEYALSYTAAGHLVGIPPVVIRGLEVASQLINWDTVERALSFAFLGAPIPDIFPGANRELRPGSQFKYGEPTQILIGGITDFLIHNWPLRFSLDTSDAKVCEYERLPYVDPTPSRKSPPIARGTRPTSMTNLSLSSIQFGDVNNPAFENSTKTMSTESLILSRLLLNMPFEVLKFTLESMAHHSPEDREKAFAEVIAEREARRTRATQRVYGGGFPSSAQMRSWLDQGGSLEFGSPMWSVFGWKEDVSRHRETGLPCLVRRWFNEPGPKSPTKA